jgi:hypothetical protein
MFPQSCFCVMSKMSDPLLKVLSISTAFQHARDKFRQHADKDDGE